MIRDRVNIFIYKVSLWLIAATLLSACSSRHATPQADIVVSIEPLKYIVERITSNNMRVSVLVPQGVGPETFDPTPRQIAELNRARATFTTGLLEFEQQILTRIQSGNIIDLSQGIELIEGSCSHSHAHGHAHAHGVDPHIWTSPVELKQMAKNCYDTLQQIYPDSTHYSTAYEQLIADIDSLHKECRQRIVESSVKAFAIYHPALTYYARAYNIEQIAIEADGKEPSAKHIANIIDKAHDKAIRTLLYQVEYPRSVVDVVAKDMGIEAKEINPLANNPLQFIKDVTSAITAN